jgi:hypothetical protein
VKISSPDTYRSNVFINCPFDREYLTLFRALVFAVQDCGFVARCAQEISDASQIRVNKIFQIISECRLGIHDISRTELDARSKLPRFNMPLELGMFLGAKAYGTKRQREKQGLIFDREQYRYQKYCSDIAGQDISAHGGSPKRAVGAVRDFLRSARPQVAIPGGTAIFNRYREFQKEFPELCGAAGIAPAELIFYDYTILVSAWLKANPRPLIEG